jgi:c-di-GMP-binding flagellar brake protein YcgR
MLQLSDMKTGTPLSLQLESREKYDPGFVLTTRVEETENDELFTIATPIWRGGYYNILPSDNVRVTFFFEDVRYAFGAKALTEFKREQLSFHTMRKITPFVEVQLREDFRLPMEDEANVIFKKQEDGEIVEYTRPVRIRDLSGGGVGFYTDWNPASLIDLRMQLRLNSITEEVNAEVRRIEERGNDEWSRYVVGAKFVYYSEREKDRIVRHIFALQKKMIQEHGKKPVE